MLRASPSNAIFLDVAKKLCFYNAWQKPFVIGTLNGGREKANNGVVVSARRRSVYETLRYLKARGAARKPTKTVSEEPLARLLARRAVVIR